MSAVLQATRCASAFMPAMTYEALSLSGSAAQQLGCMILDDRSLLTLEVLEGALHPQTLICKPHLPGIRLRGSESV